MQKTIDEKIDEIERQEVQQEVYSDKYRKVISDVEAEVVHFR